MNRKYMMMIAALAISGSLLMAVPASFAAKAMDDKEMDQTTAAGQPRIDIGDGMQSVDDASLYKVTVNGQATVNGLSIVNIAGENNVAVGVNVANVDTVVPTLTQENDITQQRNAQVVIATPGVSWSGGTVGTSAGDNVAGADITVDNINASADHIKIGTGSQTESDASDHEVTIADGAQNVVNVLSMVNGAGRNNVAVGINALNSDMAAGGIVGGAAAATLSGTTFSQSNTIMQQN